MRPLSHKDPHYRHHPWVYSKMSQVDLQADKFEYYLPEDKYINAARIIGFSVRRQSAAADRKTLDGRALAADAVLHVAFLTFKHGNADIHKVALENGAVDSKVSGIPGLYAQLCLPEGVKPSQCSINFPAGTTIAANTAIEITLHYDFDDEC